MCCNKTYSLKRLFSRHLFTLAGNYKKIWVLVQKPTFLEGVRIQLKCKSCLCTRIKQYVYGENSTSEQTENAVLQERNVPQITFE